MKCYWTVNSSYWPPLRVSQYEVNTSWPPQQKSIVLQYWKPKINSFSYAEKKKIWRMCTNFWINPHNGKLPSRLAPAQCQNSLTPQLLSKIYWSKTKTSISLNRVYWYDTMCHIFSCLCIFLDGSRGSFHWKITDTHALIIQLQHPIIWLARSSIDRLWTLHKNRYCPWPKRVRRRIKSSHQVSLRRFR